MKTFSLMSVPDKKLTNYSYHLNLTIINLMIAMEPGMPEEKVCKLKNEASRLITLIEVLESELLSE